MTIREMMIDWMIRNDLGYKITPADGSYQIQYRYYDVMSDEDLFDEFRRDVYREGQNSISWG